jgi:hypothetical protein
VSVPAREAHRARLGHDLWELVCSGGAELLDVAPVTTLGSERLPRASFRLTCADGRTLKGRRVESAAVAARVADLLPLVDPRHFPRVVGRRGAALLLEWIEGHPPDRAALDRDFHERCGALLGAVHVGSVPPPLVERHGCTAAGWSGRLARNLDRLVELRALEPDQARALGAATREEDVGASATGLVHGDFCPENLVVGGTRPLAVVDNETLTIDVLAYDLARTWHRWPMRADEAQAFCLGYRRHRDPGDYLDHRLYWDIAVLSEAAVFRLGGAIGGGSDLVRRLLSLTEGQR